MVELTLPPVSVLLPATKASIWAVLAPVVGLSPGSTSVPVVLLVEIRMKATACQFPLMLLPVISAQLLTAAPPLLPGATWMACIAAAGAPGVLSVSATGFFVGWPFLFTSHPAFLFSHVTPPLTHPL